MESENMLSKPLVSINPEVLGGVPVFAGTRVPVRSLFDHLEAGDTLEDFLERFPSITREQANAVLKESCAMLIENAAA
jgi:uncharacterized protein (DUF433 family)